MKNGTKTILLLSAWAIVMAVLVMVYPPATTNAAASYVPRNGDPCMNLVRISVPVNLAASGQVITGAAGKNTFICHLAVISATAQNIALVEGTGSTCATGIAGMAGGATAAAGWNFAIGGSMVEGTGDRFINATATSGDNVCLLLSSTGQTSGVIQYVQQ